MPIIINRLKELRKSINFTQKQMAEKLGINERHYRKYEAGEVDISASKLLMLADFYNVSIDYILCRSDMEKSFTIDDEAEIEAKIEFYKEQTEKAIERANKTHEEYQALARFVQQHTSEHSPKL